MVQFYYYNLNFLSDQEILTINNSMLTMNEKMSKLDDEVLRIWEEIEALKKNQFNDFDGTGNVGDLSELKQ